MVGSWRGNKLLPGYACVVRRCVMWMDVIMWGIARTAVAPPFENTIFDYNFRYYIPNANIFIFQTLKIEE